MHISDLCSGLWKQGSCTAGGEFLCNSLYDRDQELRARGAAVTFPLQVLQTVAMQPGNKNLSGSWLRSAGIPHHLSEILSNSFVCMYKVFCV